MIRIYDLAKDIGKKLDVDVKSSELAKEIRDLSGFGDLRDTVKSHASTVSDEVAARMTKIYEDRHGGKGAPAQGAAAPKPAPAAAQPPRPAQPAAPAPAPPQVPRPAPTAAPAPPLAPRPQAAAPPPPRPAAVPGPMDPNRGPVRPPAPQAPRPGGGPIPPRPMTGAPGVPRPVVPPPIARSRFGPPGPPPAPRGPVAPMPPRPAGPPPQHSARPAPAPGAPAPQSARAAQPKPAPAAGAPPQAAGAPAPQRSAQGSSSLQLPTLGPGRTFDTRGPRPGGGRSGPTPGMGSRGFGPGGPGGGGGGGRPGDRRGPGGPPQGRDDRRGPGGRPDGPAPRPVVPPVSRRPGDGQPAPPPLPSFHADSPFVKRPTPPPRPPQSGRPGDRGDYRPGGDRGDYRPGGDRGDHRPGGDRGGDHRPSDRPGERSGDRPGGGMGPRRDDRGPRPDDRGGPARPGGPPRPARPGGPGRDDRGPNAPLVIPDMEAMTLKEGPRRGRPGKPGDPKGGPAAPKKKGLKTIVREEIEVRPTKVYGLAEDFRRPVSTKKPRVQGGRRPSIGKGRMIRRDAPPPKVQGPVTIGSTLTVGEFAERIKIPMSEIVKKLILMGKPLTINALIDPDLCELVAMDFGVVLKVRTESDENDVETYRPSENPEKVVARPPVVTIMGHVDHGKTTLLDAFRSSQVAQREFGGITQHIGAYHVQTPRGIVVFLDTPGHEAFTNMRARGAKVTDIVVLVVSADDGVMPQTIEAINHAKEAGVPIIIAINKIDLPQANPQKVRTELMQHGIMDETFGGEHIFCEISAKKRLNLDALLELILLQAEVLELKADPTCPAEGTIIESHVDPLRGAAATILIKKGTLRVGDIFVVGTVSGRVRVMIDDLNKHVKEAGPGRPVEVIGLSGTPEVGEVFVVMAEERLAREIASRRIDRRRMKELGTTRHVTLEGLHELVAEGKLKDLKLILKADVQGSIEAIIGSLVKLNNDQVKVRFLHTGTGGVMESDVSLAAASDAIILGFNVRPDPAAAALAAQEGIEIKTYRVIYELIEEIQKAILGMLDKQYKEVTLGRVEIRQIFKNSKHGNIAGCMVLDGEITRQSKVRLVRNNVVVFDGKISTLRRVKEDAAKVAAGFECGLTLENFNDIKEGDIVEPYKMEEVAIEIVAAAAGAKA